MLSSRLPSRLRIRLVLAVLIVVVARPTAAIFAGGPLVVHEWGTFTALQNEKGEALPGINIDDEPLPPFCHNLNPYVLQSPHALAQSARGRMMKAAPPRHPYVTLRLETPVLYFHPPKDMETPFRVDVKASFRAGWLTEFYPQADPEVPGLKRGMFFFGAITPDTVGSLTWRNISVGEKRPWPLTEENVWVAPRKVEAAPVSVPSLKKDGEAENEQYLFYRGVGHRNVPLRTLHDEAAQALTIISQCEKLSSTARSIVPAAWLVHVRPDQTVAWRPLRAFDLPPAGPRTLTEVSTRFTDEEHSSGRLADLQTDIHRALVADGLFADEATALLSTWQRVYFKCPGLRLFFLVPQAWTDEVLPLSISRPAAIRRVMMGRIELVSSEQRVLLKKLSTIEVSHPRWLEEVRKSPAADQFFTGRSTFGELGVKIPDDYQTYLDLGRFRSALVLAECRERPTPQLRKFIQTYSFETEIPPTEADVPGVVREDP